MARIVDGDAVVFEGNAIQLHLAERAGRFLGDATGPAHAAARGGPLSWLMSVATGVGPFPGRAVRFRNLAPEPWDAR